MQYAEIFENVDLFIFQCQWHISRGQAHICLSLCHSLSLSPSLEMCLSLSLCGFISASLKKTHTQADIHCHDPDTYSHIQNNPQTQHTKLHRTQGIQYLSSIVETSPSLSPGTSVFPPPPLSTSPPRTLHCRYWSLSNVSSPYCWGNPHLCLSLSLSLSFTVSVSFCVWLCL